MNLNVSQLRDLNQLFLGLKDQHGWDGVMNATPTYVTFRTSNLNHFNEFKGMCFLLNLEEFEVVGFIGYEWGVGYNYA